MKENAWLRRNFQGYWQCPKRMKKTWNEVIGSELKQRQVNKNPVGGHT